MHYSSFVHIKRHYMRFQTECRRNAAVRCFAYFVTVNNSFLFSCEQ